MKNGAPAKKCQYPIRDIAIRLSLVYNDLMKSRNPVKRNMDKFQRPATHKDKKKYSRKGKKRLDKLLNL